MKRVLAQCSNAILMPALSPLRRPSSIGISPIIFQSNNPDLPATSAASVDLRMCGPLGSWLVYEYLEQASAPDRRRMEQAITRGDIAWHALPFSWQTELMDPSMIAGSIGLSQALDRRFGRTTTGAKMTDVPGHTRGLVSPLAAHGVKLFDIGAVQRRYSMPAELPPLFLWKDSAGQQSGCDVSPRLRQRCSDSRFRSS